MAMHRLKKTREMKLRKDATDSTEEHLKGIVPAADFPVLARKINGEELVYLDNSATSLTPIQVMNAMNKYYCRFNANVYRGIHSMSQEATLAYEEAHEKVAGFINADNEEVVFTKNTTESLNMVAHSLCQNSSKENRKNIVITEMEHHSNFVPWQQFASNTKTDVRIAPFDENGNLDMDKIKDMVDRDTKAVAVSHASNVLGTINKIKEIAKIAHDNDALIVVDAAQSAPHMKLDVKELDVDFLAFSGHKMLGPTGIGVLYGKKHLLEELSPLNYGGGMVKEATAEKTSFGELPGKLEAGTPDIAAGIGFAAAIDYLQSLGMNKVFRHCQSLGKSCVQMLEDSGIEVYGPRSNAVDRTGVVSFNIPGIHSHDVGTLLDECGIAIRGGHHCAMPLHKKLGVAGSCRASFYVYNDASDIEKLEKGLKKTKVIFK